jgi:transglutaminase-like putative cysteine protease
METHLKTKVGHATAERHVVEIKVYQSRPGGKLLSFLAEQTGDGGEQTLEGTATATGLRVLRKRPGRPNETLSVKPSREVVEDADQVRVALLRNATVEGLVTDTSDLEQYRVTTTLAESETRTMGGVKVRLRHVQTLSDKEKVPADVWVDEAGRTVELHYGPMMTCRAESAEVARRIDVVEVFALTRVVLPRPLPPESRQVPGTVQLVVSGLPEKFQVTSARQQYRALPQGRVEVTITARAPTRLRPRPLVDPKGGEYLKSSIVVESDAPEIKALARRIAGDEKDALTTARKVSRWVNEHLVKDYGVSSDRATDVLKEMKGDCTEHSLLTVALLRALGIPAKRIDGVMYVVNEDRVPALYWHEWVEAFVGEWTQLDPTFGQDVADATHLALGEEVRAEITPLIGSLQVHEVR